MAGSLIELARANQACVIVSLIMAGSSGPVTLAGALALQNAEILAGITLAQLVNPGTPVICGSISSAMDMRSGGLSIGCPELSMVVSATAQMARFYNLPSRSGGGLTDAHFPDGQAAGESLLAISTAVRNGINFILHSAGILGSCISMSFEKFLIDEKYCGIVRRLLRFNAVLAFDKAGIKAKTQAELDGGTDIQSVLNDGLIEAMDEVGEKFSTGELFVPEMLMAASVMKSGLEILKPMLVSGQSSSKGTVVIGTVKGVLHDIGKNLVTIMLEGARFKAVDMGVDVDSDTFVKAATEKGADVIALSALLTKTMPAMEKTVKAVKEAGIAVKTIIGGAPVTQAFADQIGAGGYSAGAPGAVRLSNK